MITRRGYEVVSEETYYKEIMRELKDKFPNMSESPGNLLAVFARVMARNENARDYERVEAYSNAYVATATGMALSKAVRTAGINRIQGTRAIGSVRISKDPNHPQAILPGATRIKSGNIEYEITKQSATIINTDTIDVQIISIDTGIGCNVPSGSKFKTVLNIAGIKDIVAISDIDGGSDSESDASLRLRYYQRMNAHSNSSLRGILDSVAAIPDVSNVDGNENNTDKEVSGMAPHSFTIYAAGGTDYDIANAIMNSKPAGIQTNGPVSVTVKVGGRDHEIRFSRFTDQEVYYFVEVVIDRAIAPPNLVDIVKEKIETYTKTQDVIVSYEISNYLSQEIDAIRGVKTILFGNSENPSSNESIVAPAGFSMVTDSSKIEVKVI